MCDICVCVFDMKRRCNRAFSFSISFFFALYVLIFHGLNHIIYFSAWNADFHDLSFFHDLKLSKFSRGKNISLETNMPHALFTRKTAFWTVNQYWIQWELTHLHHLVKYYVLNFGSIVYKLARVIKYSKITWNTVKCNQFHWKLFRYVSFYFRLTFWIFLFEFAWLIDNSVLVWNWLYFIILYVARLSIKFSQKVKQI